MTTKLAVVLADFTTQLATAMAIGATSVSLQSATDDDGIALPAGVYFFAIDGNNSQKEHIVCTLSGTSLTGISSVSRQGVQTSGCVRSHRVGSTVTLTDFAHLRYINDLVSGATTFNASVPLGYDGTASITTANQLATKAYVDGVAIAGAPNASTTVKGNVQEATQAQVLAKTAAGSTGAELYTNPSTLASTLLSDYKADTGAANAYVITPAPAITAYTVGQIFSFKATNANTTASTLNVNGLGVKTIKNALAGDLVANDILAGQIVIVEYDGTNFQMLSPSGNLSAYSLKSATTIVSVSAATAPSSGQILKATSSTAATWQPLTGATWAKGTATKNLADASTTQNIAHGLGTTPLAFRLFGISSAVQNFAVCFSGNSLGQGSTAGYPSTTFRLETTAGNHQDGVVTADATNIIITWTQTGAPSNTANIIWEACA